MGAVSDTFVGTGNGTQISVGPTTQLRPRVTGTFVGQVVLWYSPDAGANWYRVLGTSTPMDRSAVSRNSDGATWLYRWSCTEYTSGSAVCEILTALDAFDFLDLIISSGAKVGATAGWAVDAADDLGLCATLPASQTGSTLVIPLEGVKDGQTLCGFYLVGQIDSGGNAVTLDCELRRLRAAASGVVDSSLGAMAQVAVTADTEVSLANAIKDDIVSPVTAKDTYYLLVTGTTAAGTSISLQGARALVKEG